MKVSFNGQLIELEKNFSVFELLERFNMAETKVAVAINGEFAPRSCWEEIFVNENDKIDVLAAVQGG